MHRKLTSGFVFFCSLLLLSLTVSAQQSLSGTWKGHINIRGGHLNINTHFNATDSGLTGTIDIPAQGARGIPLQHIYVTKEDSIFFEFPAGPGLASFAGKLQNAAGISGTFTQSGNQFHFELRKPSQADTAKSPSTPSYHQKEVIIHNDSVDIAGTLTFPRRMNNPHLVIMISGSGAQLRDVDVYGFKVFARLADSLTQNGFATFRYDDRGSGGSTGTLSRTTLDMLASDVQAIINKFTRPSANPQFQTITLLGHSQGGIIAGQVAAQDSRVNQLILAASPGVSLKRSLRYQVREAYEEAGIADSLIKPEIAARESLMAAIGQGDSLARYQQNYRAKYEAIQRQALSSANPDTSRVSKLGRRQTKQLTSAYRSPQMQSLLFHDPTDDLRQLDIPVLVLFGGKDTQVPVHLNKKPIKKALESAGVPHQIHVFPDANHLFQKAKTGSVREYGQLEAAFIDVFPRAITHWLHETQ